MHFQEEISFSNGGLLASHVFDKAVYLASEYIYVETKQFLPMTLLNSLIL